MKARLIFLVALVLLVVSVRLWQKPASFIVEDEAVSDRPIPVAFDTEVADSDSVFFLGDIMLARDVERRLKKEEADYAFREMGFLKDATAVVGNFEAAIPSVHEPTPDLAMRFSVDPTLLPMLANAGITHTSLANNHALDFGAEGYENSVARLEENGIEAFGHPARIDKESIAYIEVEDFMVAVIGINATFGSIDPAWLEILKTAKATSDLQAIYIHWGQEYELLHDEAQEDWAHSFIDNGADLIIGHHPHVAQNIERYRHGLIVYSLGNFIFDQYWDKEVASGLMVELDISPGQAFLRLYPVETYTVRVQTRLMAGEVKAQYLQSLAGRSSLSLKEDILVGVIPLQF